jgi:hypothetical protein
MNWFILYLKKIHLILKPVYHFKIEFQNIKPGVHFFPPFGSWLQDIRPFSISGTLAHSSPLELKLKLVQRSIRSFIYNKFVF